MFHCGLDGHQKTTSFCVLDRDGRRIIEEKVSTGSTDLEALLGPLVRDGLKVGLEATSLSFSLHDRLRGIGAEVLIWPPHRLRVIAQSRAKTDRNDARWMAELLRSGCHPRPVYVPTEEERSLRDLLVARQAVVRNRTRIMLVARGILTRDGVTPPKKSLSSPQGWRRTLEDPRIPAERRALLSTFFETWTHLTEQERTFVRRLEEWARGREEIARLRGIPGVGLLAALWLRSALGDAKRFDRSREVASYLGLVPTLRESGDVRRTGHITRQGNSDARWVAVQAAHAFIRSAQGRRSPLRPWFERLAARRGKRIALVALARRLVLVAWHMLKRDEPYRPER